MVALAVTESTQYGYLLDVPPVALAPCDHHGRIRMAWFDWLNGAVAGDAGGVISVVKLPAGRVRLLGRLSSIYHNMTTGSNTIDIGWAAYTGIDGVAVDADPDGLDDGVSVETAGTINVGTVAAVAATCGSKVFESQTGVVITITSVGIVAAADVLQGFFAYVLD
jgi:hypothetical protein